MSTKIVKSLDKLLTLAKFYFIPRLRFNVLRQWQEKEGKTYQVWILNILKNRRKLLCGDTGRSSI